MPNVAILQRVCTTYRKGLFKKLSEQGNLRLKIFIGDDIPNSKVKSASDLSGIDFVRLPTRFFKVGKRLLIDHIGLNRALMEFKPDVIICEGESNLLSYLKAIFFKWKHPGTKLIHWSLGGLPGEEIKRSSLKGRVKSLLHKPFDCFIVYSSYGRSVLERLGHSSNRIIVATNVSDTDYHLEQFSQWKFGKEEARNKLEIPNRFTVLYVGAIDTNKRLDVLLQAAEKLGAESFNIVMVGDGEYLPNIANMVQQHRLKHVFLPGKVAADLPIYYSAADVFVLPGRGGMVISEAMAYALPVIVYRADGTEYDLVENNITGVLLKEGSAEEIAESIKTLAENKDRSRIMGQHAQRQIKERFNRAAMVDNLVAAVNTALHV